MRSHADGLRWQQGTEQRVRRVQDRMQRKERVQQTAVREEVRETGL